MKRADMERARQMSVRELTGEELKALLEDKPYSRMQPVRCDKCDCTQGFARRIFEVIELPKKTDIDKKRQELLRHYFLTEEQISVVSFRTTGKRMYVDSAKCLRCGSFDVVSGLKPDEEMLAGLAALSGTTPEAIKKAIGESNRTRGRRSIKS